MTRDRVQTFSRRRLVAASAAVLALGRSSTSAAQQSRGTVRVSVPTWPDDTGVIGPASTAVWTRRLASSSLLSSGLENRITGNLASLWSLNADRTELRFAIRPDALFSDGQLITPTDVLASLESARDMHANGDGAWRWEHIAKIERDSNTIVLKLVQPDASIPALLASADVPIQPAASLAARAESPTPPPTSGMFILRTFNDRLVTFVANPGFYQVGRPRLAGVVCLAPDITISRATSLVADDVDLLIDAPLLDTPMLREDPRLVLVGGPTNRLCLLQANLSRPVMANPRLRALISSAIDREKLVNAATAGEARPALTLVPPDHWATWESPLEKLEPEQVRTQLAALGEPPGLELRLIASNDDSSLANACVFLQEQLAWAGIALSLDLVSPENMGNTLAAGNWDLRMFYTAGWQDPHELFRPLVASDGSSNVSGYTSRRIDYLVALAARSRGEVARAQYYQTIQQIVANDVPLVPLFFPNYFDAMTKRIASYPFHPPESAKAMAQATLDQPAPTGAAWVYSADRLRR